MLQTVAGLAVESLFVVGEAGAADGSDCGALGDDDAFEQFIVTFVGGSFVQNSNSVEDFIRTPFLTLAVVSGRAHGGLVRAWGLQLLDLVLLLLGVAAVRVRPW